MLILLLAVRIWRKLWRFLLAAAIIALLIIGIEWRTAPIYHKPELTRGFYNPVATYAYREYRRAYLEIAQWQRVPSIHRLTCFSPDEGEQIGCRDNALDYGDVLKNVEEVASNPTLVVAEEILPSRCCLTSAISRHNGFFFSL